MKIHEFNIKKGIYKFELDEIETDFHAHPTFEMVYSKNGGIEIETSQEKFSNVHFGIIGPNIPHKISSQKGDVMMVMVECNLEYMFQFLSTFDIHLKDGIFIEKEGEDRTFVINEIANLLREKCIPIASDDRVNKSLDYLNQSSSEYKTLMTELKSLTNLSDSRLSHLFKEELGISIKKYFVWSKLKRAFEKVLYDNKNMYEASIELGFYDQAHLSKAFKQMLGISPSDVYNSRMIQV